MTTMKHFVISLIGLGIYDEARLQKIIDLFDAITLRSLANQRSSAFVSLIVIDAHMPISVRTRLNTLLAGRQNFFLVPIDVTKLIHVRTGCFDWVWDHCQDFILKNGLVDNPHDYIISSILDSYHAWHRDVVAKINGVFAEQLPDLLRKEKSEGRTMWTNHSAGMVVTFTKGYQWYLAANAIEEMVFPFHCMAVFVTSRFSSGVSACSSRHSEWPDYSKVVQFEVGLPNLDSPMWIFSRHGEAIISPPSFPVSEAVEKELSDTFGVDIEKVREWCVAYPAGQRLEHSGQLARQQFDLIFRIAALNRKIRALRTSVLQTSPSAEFDQLEPWEMEREDLIEKLQG